MKRHGGSFFITICHCSWVIVFVTLASGRTHPEYPARDGCHFKMDLVVDMFYKYFDAGLDLIERFSFSITGEKEMTLARQ